MGNIKRSLLWCGICTSALASCVEAPPAPDVTFGPPMGGYDKNSPFFNLPFDVLADELDFTPGISTVSAANDFAFELTADPVPACGLPGLQRTASVIGTRAYPDRVVGSNLLIYDQSVWRGLANGERVTFMARMVNSAGHRELVVLDATRGPDLHTSEAPNLWWPQFALRVARASTCAPLAEAVVILGAPVAVPLTGTAIGTRAGAFTAYASYFKDQHPSIVTKALINGPLPTVLSGESGAGMVRACGTSEDVEPNTLTRTAAFALGHGAPVHVPDDAGDATVIALMTEEGRLVRLHAETVTAGGSARGLCFGPGFPAGPIGGALPRLAPPSAATGDGDPQLDVIEVSGRHLDGADRPTSSSILLATGDDRSRRDAYLEASKNPWRYEYVAQLDAAIEQTVVDGRPGSFAGWLSALAVVPRKASLFVATAPAPAWYSTMLAGDATAPADHEMGNNCGNGWCGVGETCAADCGFAGIAPATTLTDDPVSASDPAPWAGAE